MDQDLIEFMKVHQEFELIGSGKLKCVWTGHELPPSMKDLNNYLNSKGYKKAMELSSDYTAYMPHIIPSKSHADKVYCQLTRRLINKSPKQVQEHVKGRLFQKRKLLFEKGEIVYKEEEEDLNEETHSSIVPNEGEEESDLENLNSYEEEEEKLDEDSDEEELDEEVDEIDDEYSCSSKESNDNGDDSSYKQIRGSTTSHQTMKRRYQDETQRAISPKRKKSYQGR